MRRELNKLPIEGTVVIGEGERDEAPMLFIGEKVGMNAAPRSTSPSIRLRHHAVRQEYAGRDRDHGDGRRGTLLHAPDVYMQKIAVGPGYAKALSNLTHRPPTMFAAWPRRKGSNRRRSLCWCSIARATPISFQACAARVLRYASSPMRCGRSDPLRRSGQYRVDMYIAPAARPKACWRRRRCVASAARCSAG